MSAVIHLGDCLEVMKQYPDGHFDAVICDPPYGTTALAFDQTPIDWPAWWAEVHRVTKETGVIVCFAADLFTVDLIQSNRKNYRYRLVWEKTMATGFLNANRRPLKAHEDVLVFTAAFKGSTYNPQKTTGHVPGKRTTGADTIAHYNQSKIAGRCDTDDTRYPRTVLKFGQDNTRAVGHHPTQKPLALMEWLVKAYTNPGDKVLDPFAGSGSTGVACLTLGRDFVGVELDPTYHATATRRSAHAQPALLGVS